ncbi:MAG: hypothetical protein M3Q07_06320 [Pseudobdellovibrionaceae bacterium]|nr:hypothetical protein [Pseudobdellovibrionaceae bacterium]
MQPRSIPSVRTMLLILGGLTAFGPPSIDMYLPAFPTMASDFGVPVASMLEPLRVPRCFRSYRAARMIRLQKKLGY